MNPFDEQIIDLRSFAYLDLLSQDRWESFAVSSSVSTAGSTTISGRYRVVGKSCQFQISAAATSSFATTSGTHYFELPIAAAGLGGIANMTNATSNTAVGACHIAVSTSRVYLPSQGDSTNTFIVAGYYEIG